MTYFPPNSLLTQSLINFKTFLISLAELSKLLKLKNCHQQITYICLQRDLVSDWHLLEKKKSKNQTLWLRGVVVVTTAQLHSTKPELRFCADSNPARGVSEIHDGENLWQ